MKILIVDDDKSTLLMLRLLLAREGWEVDGELDAAEGLAAVEKRAYDWLVVDGQIFPFDGIELAARAKALRPDLGIVMISGVYQPADIAGSPIRALFQKPVDPDLLIAMREGGSIVAAAAGVARRSRADVSAAPVGHVKLLAVAPAWQGRGVGSASLMK